VSNKKIDINKNKVINKVEETLLNSKMLNL